ncbi:MAG: hypothetical protein HOQ32_01120 [Lysobacter sp.]|nr:hypothetical protein [Lysobacter sp.]
MARKNLARRADIESGVLRQRRDFYAIAIGLLLFQLAHGSIEHANTIGGMLPLKFDNPCWFLWSAWIGFAYFLLRYRLMAPPSPFGMWGEEALLQAGNTMIVRKIAATFISHPGDDYTTGKRRAELLSRAGPIPKIVFKGFLVDLDLQNLTRGGAAAGVESGGILASYVKSLDNKLTFSQQLLILACVLFGWLTAIWREHSFTDYCLPYLFGLFTIVVAIFRWLSGATHLCIPWF